MDYIEEILQENGIKSQIETNGYWYKFNHNDLHIEFVVQSNYNGNGRFSGEIYKKNLSSLKVNQMKKAFQDESLTRISNPIEWVKNVKKYNHRRISIPGYLDNIIPELMELINMPLESYISLRLENSEKFKEIVGKTLH